MADNKDEAKSPPEGNSEKNDPVADLTPQPVQPPEPPKPKRLTVQLPATIKGPVTPMGVPVSPLPSSVSPGKKHHDTESIFARKTSRRALTLSIARTDLLQEKILRDAPRMTYEGVECPCLGGIALLAKLGQGGMGAVYYGVHPRVNAEVAVKVLPFHLADQDATLVDRFIREAQIAAQVRSPNLVHVVDVNQESGLWYLVMEYVYGTTGGKLLAALRQKATVGLPEIDAIDVCISASMGLLAAHNRNVVHRDIKPDNIMIPRKDPGDDLDYGNSKLTDLGLARVQSGDDGKSNLTATESAMGTPGYMAPEQALDAKRADVRSDIFSMGATLYALLAGHSPFHRENPMKTIFATAHEDPSALREIRPDVAERLALVINTCIEKNSDARFPNVEILIKELERCRESASRDQPQAVENSTFVYPAGSLEAKTPASGKKAAPGAATPRPTPAPPAASASGTEVAPAKPHGSRAGMAAAALIVVLAGGAAGAWKLGYFGKNSDSALIQWHSEKLNAARESAKAGRFDAAAALLDEARTKKIDDASCAADEAAVQTFIESEHAARKKKFDASLKDFDAIAADPALTEDHLIQAQAQFASIKLATPADEVSTKLVSAREATLMLLRQKVEAEAAKPIDDALKTARAAPPGQASVFIENVRNLIQASPVLSDSKLRPSWESELEQIAKSKAAGTSNADRRTQLHGDLKRAVDTNADTADLQKQLVALEKEFPGDAQLAACRELIGKKEASDKRKADSEKHLDAAETLIGKAEFDKAQLELKAAEAADPANARLDSVWQKLGKEKNQLGKKLSEKERHDTVMTVLAEFDKHVNADELRSAGENLAVLDALATNDERPMFSGIKLKYDKKKAEQEKHDKFTKLIAEAGNLLGDTGRTSEAREKLVAAQELFPEDALLAEGWKKLEERKSEEQKRQKFDTLIQEAGQSLEKGGDLAAIREKLTQAQVLFSVDSKLPPLWQKLSERTKDELQKAAVQAKRAEFEGLVKAAGSLIDGGNSLDAAGQKIKKASELFPDDPQLALLRKKWADKLAAKPAVVDKGFVGENKPVD